MLDFFKPKASNGSVSPKLLYGCSGDSKPRQGPVKTASLSKGALEDTPPISLSDDSDEDMPEAKRKKPSPKAESEDVKDKARPGDTGGSSCR